MPGLRFRSMTPEVAKWVEAVRREFGDLCFACGRKNSVGLHLEEWDFVDGMSVAVFKPRPEHVGADETLHGGLAATVLDEALAWAVMFTHHVLPVTGTLDLRFRKPLYVHDTITAYGRVDDRSGRRLSVSGYLDAGNGPAAEARGLFLVKREIPPPKGG